MALTTIFGKPGSGKSYHVMSLFVDMLVDWVRYELKHGKPFDSSIWTNMVINVEGMNKTVSERVGKEVDISHYVNYCDEDFFNDDGCVFWWTKFPAKSLIVLDEVHMYLARDMGYGAGGVDRETEFMNCVSVHRHRQEEWWLVTQHPDQFSRTILGVADRIMEVVNMKSMNLPFPISVPVADIDEIKKSFGIKTQYYQVNHGNFRGKAIKWDGTSDKRLMSAAIFRVYRSHDAGADSDRPELERTPIEAIWWFTKKHGWHLIPKISVIPLLFFVVVPAVIALPSTLMSAVIAGREARKEKEKTVTKIESVDSKKGTRSR